jgi:hypothetical protein
MRGFDAASLDVTGAVSRPQVGERTNETSVGQACARADHVPNEPAALRCESPPIATWKWAALLQSCSRHANVAIRANDRQGIERLARYLDRGPIATKRLCLRTDSRHIYALQRPWRDRNAAIAMTHPEILNVSRRKSRGPANTSRAMPVFSS